MFEALLEKRAAYRAHHRDYQKQVDDCLASLFGGFAEASLPVTPRRQAGHSSLVRRGEAEGTDARTCAVQAAVLLIRKLIGALSEQDRRALTLAFLRKDAGNPTYRGFQSLFRAVERLDVSPALVAYLNIEVAGHLRGMTQEAIFGSWVEGQVGGVMGRLRERCLQEADFRADLWQ